MRVMDLLSRYSVEQEDVVGVDITQNYIRLAQLTKKKEQWVLEKLGYRYLDHGNVGIATDPDKYADKLRELISASKISTTNAAVSIPITSAIIRVVTLPLMTDEELQRAIDTNSLWVNTIQLSDKIEEYSVFWQTIHRNTANNTMNILFVASKLADINTYTSIASRAGLNPVIVDIRCFATRNAYKLLPALVVDTGVNAVLELGTAENYLLVIHNDAPFISDIYLSEPDRDLLNDTAADNAALVAFCERYVTQVKQAILAFEGHAGTARGKTLITQIQLVSSLPHIETILPVLASRLDGYKIELFDPTRHLLIPENLKEKIEAEPNPSVFTSVLGLATRKLDVFGYYKYVTGVNNINLLPNREAVRQTAKGRAFSGLAVGAVAALIVLGIGLTYWIQTRSSEELLPQAQEATQIEGQVAQLRTDIQSLKEEKNRYQTLAKAVQNQGQNADYAFAVFDELIRAVPAGVWLSDVSFTGAETMTVRGEAQSEQAAHRFVERLNQGHAIQKTSLQNMSEMEPATGNTRSVANKTFELRCVLIQPHALKQGTVGGQP